MDEAAMKRVEYPRPDFERENWVCLNGEWDFAFDYNNEYEIEGRTPEISFNRKIFVPFCYESELSGLGTDEPCESLWYGRRFTIGEEKCRDSAVLLKFGAVDYRVKIWINGMFAGAHIGGFTPFEPEISTFVIEGENTLLVKVEDSYSKEQPRGKQMWGQKPELCWYTNTSGIWQSVWLEFTGRKHIRIAHVTPDIDNNCCYIEVIANQGSDCKITAELSKNGLQLGSVSASVRQGRAFLTYKFKEYGVKAAQDLYWSPDYPNLIDIKLTLTGDCEVFDVVRTYFGMRKISWKEGRIYLNNERLYQRLVLDQGYWPDSLMTPPSDEAIRLDVELTKKLGFNGARKHQKIEDPRYYYWADKLGLLVWGELPSAYEYTATSINALIRDMGQFIERDYNHPCIILWVTLNESWGVHRIKEDRKQKNFAKMLYHYVRCLDQTRMISSNDGWEQVNPTDISAIHDYDMTPANAGGKYAGDGVLKVLETNAQSKAMYADGEKYSGEPIMITEYGGLMMEGSKGWGYQGVVKDEQEYLANIGKLTSSITANERICGFCYTQLTDVMQEVNGLLDENRNPKANIDKISRMFTL